ncbi:MAG: hypothetical protein IPG22_22695 [Acidobacteria bacterium]|nr:hypothetical protein [Acidobacteriota bacterium]
MLPWGDLVNGFNDDGCGLSSPTFVGSEETFRHGRMPDRRYGQWATRISERHFLPQIAQVVTRKERRRWRRPGTGQQAFLSSVSRHLSGRNDKTRTKRNGDARFANPSPIRRVLTQAEIESIVTYIRSLSVN